ncbi:MAG: glycosyltransferase family 4 protein [Patescibacteria group bacterium]
MAKRVLIYSTAYYPLVGGAEVAVKELTDRLPDWDFELITARLNRAWPKREQIGRVLVHRIGWGFGGDKLILAFGGGRFGQKLQRQKPFQLVWGVMASFGALAAMDFKRLNPIIPYLLTLQEGDDLKTVEKKMAWLPGYFHQVFARADYVQAISNYLALWAKRMGVTAPIEVVPNGVDLDKFNPPSASWRRREKLNTGERIIVSASRLVKKNGLSDLILALKFLPENVKLQLLGEGPERASLEALVKANHLESRVIFVGFVPAEHLIDYYAKADVFCRPSLSEGLGNAFLEAMAAGLPVVGTNVGGIPDFLIDNKTGFLTEVKNPESLASRLALVFNPNQQVLVTKVCEQAKVLVEEKYNWTKIASRFNRIFSTLCQKNP